MKKAVVVGMYVKRDEPIGRDDGGTGYGNLLLYPGILARRMLEPMGVELCCEAELPLEKADILFCIDLTPELYERIRKLPSGIFKILQSCESPLYAPLSHSGAVIMEPLWDVVMTWNRAFEADYVVHYDIPVAGKSASGLPDELPGICGTPEMRCAVVASCKVGDHRGFAPERDIFYRKMAAKRYLDLYGMGWRIDPSAGRMGPVSNKLETLRKYSFAVVIENTWSSGYVTEKLPDCILAGLPVIYYGDTCSAAGRFPGTFVPLAEISEKAFLSAREQIFADYPGYHEAVRRSRAASDSWCDSYLEAVRQCFGRAGLE